MAFHLFGVKFKTLYRSRKVDIERMNKHNLYTRMMTKLNSVDPRSWEDIDRVLSEIRQSSPPLQTSGLPEFLESLRKGIAFVTYDYGIDGVSIEISKYAQSLQDILSNGQKTDIVFIGGDFFPQADSVLKPEWKRFRIEGFNGWAKWDGGKWFAKLFYEELPEDSRASNLLATEIWKQAITLSEKLGRIIVENDIHLLFPVNVSSNPGNLAVGLCIVLVSEAMEMFVLNSNHDFYWESGKPALLRKPGEAPGPRDHFFRNIHNRSFFSFFEKLYPWNGRRWMQVNINRLQSSRLIEQHGFPQSRVCEISTSLSDEYFREYNHEHIKSVRLRMAHILSNGQSVIHPIPIHQHLADLNAWMSEQKPLVIATREGLSLDITSDLIIYLLQPTRVIARKRIQKDCQLIGALLHFPPFLNKFKNNPQRKIVLHITGPTPIEHQADLEIVLHALVDVYTGVPESISDRIFLAFSVGNEEHPCFPEKGFRRMSIEDIYRLATAVLFPSETEGRGLPIGESAASEIPIICSRYSPEDVFADVVGENLPKEEQILYTLFPEEGFPESFLSETTELLLHPERNQERIAHNKKAARFRYGREVMKKIFMAILSELSNSK